MRIAGIDYSFTSPSITIYDTEKEFKFENLKFYNINSTKSRAGVFENVDIRTIQKYNNNEERFNNLCEWASQILKDNEVEEVVIEGYALGSRTGLVFQIAENTSLLKQFMNKNGILFTTPAPTQVKKHFTGSGKAKKEDMIDKFNATFPDVKFHELINVKKEYAKPIDDIVDSFAILLMHPAISNGK